MQQDSWILENQSIDATSIRGDVAIYSPAQLISKTCVHLARKLEEEGHPVLFEEEKKETLQKAIEKAFHVLEAASTVPEAEHEREILHSILADYTECSTGTVTERKKKGEDRIVSVTDEDVRWGAKSDRKTWPGYKLHNTMTENRFITALEVTAADVTDDKMAVLLYDRQTFKLFIIPADALYSTGENRQAFDKRGCLLIAPVRSQENPTGLYPKSCFSWDEGKVTCPAGKTTITYTKNDESRCFQYRFTASDCQQCSLKDACTMGVQDCFYLLLPGRIR